MSFVSEGVVVSRSGDNDWVLQKPLVYRGRYETFEVPAGFVTDFATVPRLATWLAPRFGKYTEAAILHDWLCTIGIEIGRVNSRDADGIFRRVMRELGVPWLLRWLMWTGVRWGALFNRKRRPGVTRDLDLVLLLSLIALPLALPAAAGIGLGLLAYSVVERVIGLVLD